MTVIGHQNKSSCTNNEQCEQYNLQVYKKKILSFIIYKYVQTISLMCERNYYNIIHARNGNNDNKDIFVSLIKASIFNFFTTIGSISTIMNIQMNISIWNKGNLEYPGYADRQFRPYFL